jgi:SAM-dependent methyltransferase
MAISEDRTYWEQRLTRNYSLAGVGWSQLGTGFNRWLYRVRRHLFMETLRPFLNAPGSARVLDIGSGTGFYVDRWHELGVRTVTGTDITQAAVDRLSDRYPADRFLRFDAGAEALPFEPASFDAVSAMDVLFHIMDDERFARAFRNVSRLLKPGGVFVFSENGVHGNELRTSHWVSRPLADIEALLAESGLELQVRRPMFVLLNAPVDSRSRTLNRSWRYVKRLAMTHRALGTAVGAILYPLERALVSRVQEGPSTELFVCRRAADGRESGVTAVQRSLITR